MGRQKIAFAMSGPNRDASRKSSEIRVATERTSLELDRLLDAALEDTFPASDPISNLRGSFPADN